MPPRKKTKTSHFRDDTRACSASRTSDITVTDVAKPPPPRRHVRGKRGGLKDMPNMPLDIVMEIVRLLHPRDVLNLARTSKSFQVFLMSRAQASLWKAARAQVEELPDLPPWLSEPAYANLMFFTNCQICLKPNIQHAYYEFGVRYCEACSYNMILTHGALQSFLDSVQKELGSDAPDNFLSTEFGRAQRRHICYFKPQVNDFRRKWNELANREDRIQFVQECHKDVIARHQLSYKLSHWVSIQKDARRQEKEDLKIARFRAVKTRLRDEGWSKELAFMDQKALQRVYEVPAVCRPTKLNDRAWQKMRDDVVAIMQEYRNERLRHERFQVLISRMRLMREAFAEHLQRMGQTERPRTTTDDLAPEPGDFAYLPEFREVIEAESEVTVTKHSFALLLESWPDLVARWTQQRKAEFTKKLLPALKGAKVVDAEETLDLAIAAFSCRKCWGIRLRWPFILSHPCFRHHSNIAIKTDYDVAVHKSSSLSDLFVTHDARPNVYIFQMCGVIAACSQDPDSVTWEAMQECPTRLKCKLCSQPDRCLVYDWLAAVEHETGYHRHDKGATGATLWQPVPEDQAAQAASLAAALDISTKNKATYNTNGQHYLACAWCPRYRAKYVTHMRMHVEEKHGKKPVDGVDFYAPEESTPRMRKGYPPVWMYDTGLAEDAEIVSIVAAGAGFFAPFPLHGDTESKASAPEDRSNA